MNSTWKNGKQMKFFCCAAAPKAYLLAMLNGFRGKRSEMKSEDHLTLIDELGDLDERPKKYNRARVLLGSAI